VPDSTVERPFATPAATRTPLPTPTPFRYTIEEGDTLLTIAFQFGVTVDDIVALNPGLDPRLLSVGTAIIIPLGEGDEVAIPTPTPVSYIRGMPRCWASAEGGLRCFVTVLNENNRPLEGAAVRVNLYTRDGRRAASQVALPPVNLILPGEALPLEAYFPPPVPQEFQARAEPGVGFLVEEDPSARYLPHRAELRELTLRPGGRQASLTGGVVYTGEAEVQGLVVVAAIAYGADSEVIGLRRWETAASLVPGQELTFSLQVYSLGPRVETVRLFTEIQPQPEPVG
jgi:LysM repeat protein